MRGRLSKIAVPFLVSLLFLFALTGCRTGGTLPEGEEEAALPPASEEPAAEPSVEAGGGGQPQAVSASIFTIYPGTDLLLHQEGGSGVHKAMFTLWSETISGTIRFVPDNLYRREGGTIFAERVQITPDPSTVDRLDIPSPFVVTVNLPDGTSFERGTYEGTVFLFYGEAQDFITLTLTLDNAPDPVLAIDNPTPIRLNEVVNRQVVYPLVLLESGGANDARQVQLGTSMLMGVEDNTAFLPANVVTQTLGPVTLLRDGQLSYPLLFDFGVEGVQAGSYSGKVVLSSENADNLEIPVELTLKHGLGWPLIVLLLSVIIGWLIAYYSTESQERDRVYSEIRKERERLQEGRFSSTGRVYQHYWLCGDEIERLLDLAQETLDRNRPGSLEAARASLDKVYDLHNLRENRDLFDDLVKLRTQIFRGLDRFESFTDDMSDYPYVEQSLGVLRDIRDDLPQCRKSEECQETEQAVVPHLRRLQVLLQAWKMSWQLEDEVRVFLDQHGLISGELGEEALMDVQKLEKLERIAGNLRGSQSEKISSEGVEQGVNEALNEIMNLAKVKRVALQRFGKDVAASDIEPLRDQLRQAHQDLRAVFGAAVVEWILSSLQTDDWEYDDDWGTMEGYAPDISPGFDDRVDAGKGEGKLRSFLRRLGAGIRRIGALLPKYMPSIRLTSYRTVLAIATLFALGYLGLVEIYFKDATFGDNLVEDYAALIVWGLTANATQEGVFQLLGSLGSRIRSSQQEQPQPALPQPVPTQPTPTASTPSPPAAEQKDGQAEFVP